MDWKAVIGKDTVKIKAKYHGRSEHVKGETLCKLKATGNGYIATMISSRAGTCVLAIAVKLL